MSEQLELPVTEEINYIVPENYDKDSEYCLYSFGDNKLYISNSWSRKSIRKFYTDTTESMVWTLNNKCVFELEDEFGNSITKDITDNQYEELSIDVSNFIIDSLVNHIDFLVETLVRKKNEK